MEKTFELTIVTPEKVTHEGTAQGLTLPAWEGSMGILPGHQAALVFLQEGVVKVQDANGEKYLSVSGGFAEIQPKKVTLFAETAEMAQELDEERAKLAAARAKEVLTTVRKTKGYDSIDVEQAQASLRRALVRIKVSELRRGHTRHGSVVAPHDEN